MSLLYSWTGDRHVYLHATAAVMCRITYVHVRSQDRHKWRGNENELFGRVVHAGMADWNVAFAACTATAADFDKIVMESINHARECVAHIGWMCDVDVSG